MVFYWPDALSLKALKETQSNQWHGLIYKQLLRELALVPSLWLFEASKLLIIKCTVASSLFLFTTILTVIFQVDPGKLAAPVALPPAVLEKNQCRQLVEEACIQVMQHFSWNTGVHCI